MSTDQLKPCPFCGSAATLDDDRLLWVVRCTGCGTCVLGERAEEPERDLPASYWEPFRQSAIDRWNRRAALAQPAPVEPTDEEMNDTYWKAWHEHLDRTNSVLHAAGLRAVLTRWGRPAIAPIPVSERLPGAEGAIQALNDLPDDQEAAHGMAEDILCQLLRDTGYKAVADAFEQARDRIGFWYA